MALVRIAVRALSSRAGRMRRELGRRTWAAALAALAGLAGMLLLPATPGYPFPWSIDMFRGEAVQPLEVAPRVMPAGTLPVDGTPPMSLEKMTLSLHNPLKPTPHNLAHGRELFTNNCEPCHGASGTGDGPVAHLLKHKPANLIRGASKGLPDGYIYGYIRNGGFFMPAYGDAMDSEERWDVVMYVRQLQRGAGGASQPRQAAAQPAPAAK